jgi:hypothetical protein
MSTLMSSEDDFDVTGALDDAMSVVFLMTEVL